MIIVLKMPEVVITILGKMPVKHLEVVKDLKESAKSSTAFQIRVMSVGAVLLSLASLFFTVLKMFVIK